MSQKEKIMGHDPAEKTMPRTLANPGKSDAFGDLRFQGPTQDIDAIHVHDDKQGLVFIWEGGRTFFNAWKHEFLPKLGMLMPGQSIAFIGATKTPEKGRKAGVLVFERLDTGETEIRLDEYDPQKGYEEEIHKCSGIEWIDDWINRKC
jgi:hypothetical protein